MFNYKRLTFIFIFLSFLLTISDSTMERQAKKSLLSLVNIVVEEGSEVGENAPGSFLDSMESGRLGLYSFFDKQADLMTSKSSQTKGLTSISLTAASVILNAFKFICSYVIIFYPLVIILLYFFFTSRFFRRNDYYDNYYGSY